MFFRHIVTKERFPNAYFYVEFCGTSFAKSVSGKKFVYKGDEAEKLGDFIARMQKRYATAQIIREAPTANLMMGTTQCIQDISFIL